MNARKNISDKPAWLYHGKVMHARMSPKKHRFQYSVYSLLIDIDRLDEADKISPIFSVDRFNLVSFSPEDHLQKDGDLSLRQHVEKCLKSKDISWRPSRILLACYPRILGKVFNPLSIFYVYKDEGEIGALIYEVRNTFGEKHLYICPIDEKNLTGDHIRQQVDKNFYVSPFMEMDMRYFFTISEPYEEMSWRIVEKQSSAPVLAATYFGHQKEFNSTNLARFFLQIPLLTWKILAGIHFEALRLWLKGLKLVPKKAAEDAQIVTSEENRNCQRT